MSSCRKVTCKKKENKDIVQMHLIKWKNSSVWMINPRTCFFFFFFLCKPKGIYVTRITPKGPAEMAGLMMGDKILQVCNEVNIHKMAPFPTFRLQLMPSQMWLFHDLPTPPPPSPHQVNGWDMTMVTHDKARKRLTKKKEDVVRLLVTRKSLEDAVKKSMSPYHK